MRRLLVAAAFAATVLAAGAPPASASFPGANGLVAALDASRPHKLFAVDEQGRRRRELTTFQVLASAAFSPDGRRLVFATPGAEIVVANADGTGGIVLAAGWAPGWSPDGSQIAFTRNDGVYVMN